MLVDNILLGLLCAGFHSKYITHIMLDFTVILVKIWAYCPHLGTWKEERQQVSGICPLGPRHLISQLCILKPLCFSWSCGRPGRGSQCRLPLTSSPRMEQLKTVSGSHTDYCSMCAHRCTHTHRHTRASAHRPAQPQGSTWTTLPADSQSDS